MNDLELLIENAQKFNESLLRALDYYSLKSKGLKFDCRDINEYHLENITPETIFFRFGDILFLMPVDWMNDNLYKENIDMSLGITDE